LKNDTPKDRIYEDDLSNTSPKGKKPKMSFKIFPDVPHEKRRNSFNQMRKPQETINPLFDQQLERNPTIKVQRTPDKHSGPPFKLIIENVVDFFEKKSDKEIILPHFFQKEILAWTPPPFVKYLKWNSKPVELETNN
jgi:hypothetical protein